MHNLINDFIQVNQPLERIYLWGMPGSGKSSTGKKLAGRLDWSFVDLDTLIESSKGKSIAALFEEAGEAEFRKVERGILEETLSMSRVVVACGGGTPCFHGSAEDMIREGLCLWLDAPVGMLAERLASSTSVRPLLIGYGPEGLRKALDDMLHERQQHYRKAHMIVSVKHLNMSQLGNMLKSIIQGK